MPACSYRWWMLVIERLGPDGWERARNVRMRALEDAPDAFWITAEEEGEVTAAEWRRRLGRSDAATFLATRDGEDVGIAVGAGHHAHPTDAGLYAVWVAPHARGGGVARALVDRVIEWARGLGFQDIRLDVGDANAAAVAFYERLGFSATGAGATFPPPREHLTEHERVLHL